VIEMCSQVLDIVQVWCVGFETTRIAYLTGPHLKATLGRKIQLGAYERANTVVEVAPL
jgi:hypothetical protein